MYLDYAEDQAQSRKPMYMADWVKKLNGFLQFNEKNILTHAGKISQKMALEHAENEFEKFEVKRRHIETNNLTNRALVETAAPVGMRDLQFTSRTDTPGALVALRLPD